MSTWRTLSEKTFLSLVAKLNTERPLVHCMTNDVVQEITANVLLAAGASPAMIIAREESADFARVASSLLVNTGTIFPERLEAMKAAIVAAYEAGKPWVLDPVAAGVLPWRDRAISELIALHPTVIRANASEIMALAHAGHGGKGVDSTNTSLEALDAAQTLARQTQAIVAVTGETDFVTDGTDTIEIKGGHVMATLVVGTGCALSALTCAFCAVSAPILESVASAMMMAKKAQERAFSIAKAPGSFHSAYIDALYCIAKDANHVQSH